MRRSGNERNLAKRTFFALESRFLARYELDCLRRSNAASVCSENEYQLLGSKLSDSELYVVPNGVDGERFSIPSRTSFDNPQTLVFVGT